MFHRFIWCLVRLLTIVLLRRSDVGVENVPRDGAVIVAANHISNLDPPIVGTGYPRLGNYMAKEELFVKPAFARLIRKLNAFPVKRGTADKGALKHSLDVLAEGKLLVMFPEGTRSEDGELKQAEMGVGMIAVKSGAQVVPAYIWGTNDVMPKQGGIRLARIGVRYGKPICFAAPEGSRPGREEYEAAANAIMAAIAALRDEHRAEIEARK